ncbi:MAG: CbtB domain-containing protein [Sporichthyaceae bacterium]
MNAPASLTPERATPVVVSAPAGFAWLLGTSVLAVLVYYFIGIEQGMVSMLGAEGHVHEFVHDARHLLGFPCH